MKIQHHQLIRRYPQHSDARVICQSFHPRRLYIKALIEAVKKRLYAHLSSPIQSTIILIYACISSSLGCGPLLNFYRHYQTSLQKMLLISLNFFSQLRVIVVRIAQHFIDFIRQQLSQLTSYFSLWDTVFSEIAPYRGYSQTGRGCHCDVRAVALHPTSVVRTRPGTLAINPSQTIRNNILLPVCLVPKRSLSLDHLLINSDHLRRGDTYFDQLTSPSANLALDGGLQLLEAFAQGRFIRHMLKTTRYALGSVSLQVAIERSKFFDTFEHHQQKESQHHQFRVFVRMTSFWLSSWRIDFAHFFKYFNEVVVGGKHVCLLVKTNHTISTTWPRSLCRGLN